MKKFSKIIAVLLALVLVFGLAACDSKSADSGSQTTKEPTQTQPTVVSNGDVATPTATPAPIKTEKRTNDVYIGTWWVQHYDSADTDLADSNDWGKNQDKDDDTEKALEEKAINRAALEERFNNVKRIEDRYGIKFYWQNLTYEGVIDSINTSILAGTPDCDIYLVEAGTAIPAQMNNLCVDLKQVLPADHDLFTTQIVAKYLDMGDGRACIIQRQGGMDNNHALGFNKQLLEANGLEDPRDLWDKGEWTWEKFREYCKILTQDTDGDGEIDQYGFIAWDSDQIEEFMLSNGANIAATPTQALTSQKMTEVLQFIYDLHNVDKVCAYVDSTMDANDVRTSYRNGNIGFFWIDVWVQEQNGSDYDYNGDGANPLIDFDVVYTHWPVGPSGNPATDPQLNAVGGELYIIPAGVQDPATVFGVLYDMWNWYDLDVSKRDNPALNGWWVNASGRTDEYRQSNYKIQNEILAKKTVDLWNSIGVEFNTWELLDGTVTPAQWQETYKQAFQDALDQYFN